jgi:biotin carboxyl carrier protein
MESNSQIHKTDAAHSKSSKDCDKNILNWKTLIIHGEQYRTTFTKKYENRKKWVKPNKKHVISYIPGTITELLVKEGQTVRKGENMLLLEAMKMLNLVSFPLSGQIKKVNVKVGDRIPKGFLMVEYK